MKYGVKLFIFLALTIESGCGFKGGYVPPPPANASCEQVATSVCQKIDTCLTKLEKLAVTPEDCLRKATPVVCTLMTRDQAMTDDCARNAINIHCKEIRDFVFFEVPMPNLSAQCNTFFAIVRDEVEK